MECDRNKILHDDHYYYCGDTLSFYTGSYNAMAKIKTYHQGSIYWIMEEMGGGRSFPPQRF